MGHDSGEINKLQNAGYEGIVIRPEDAAVGINIDMKGVTYGTAIRKLAELNDVELGEKQI